MGFKVLGSLKLAKRLQASFQGSIGALSGAEVQVSRV